MEVAATALVGDIRAAFDTGALTSAEATKLMGALTGMVGSTDLAAEYVGRTTNGRLNRLVPQSNPNQSGKTFVDNPFDNNGNLKFNVTYSSGEFGYHYETDDLSRLSNFSADDLQITDRDGRLRHNPNTPGKLPGDHAGHLAGDLFGGSGQLDNLVSQSPNVNLSEYRKIENIWAKVIKEGKKVSVNVDVVYEGSLRPSEFIVKYEINGDRFYCGIKN